MATESTSAPVYMSVKDAINEQAQVREMRRINAPRTVRMPPDWGTIHRKEELSQSRFGPRAGPPPKGQSFVPRASTRRKDSPLNQSSTISQASVTSSVAHHLPEGPDPARASTVGPGWLPGSHGAPGEKPGSPAASGYGVMPTLGARIALGGSDKSGLNHTSTFFYGEAPLKPQLSNNMYDSVGSYSMLGSQARSKLASSAAYGFGTATRQQMMNTYAPISHVLWILPSRLTRGRAEAENRASALAQTLLDDKCSTHALVSRSLCLRLAYACALSTILSLRYMSPAHLKVSVGKYSPSPSTYTLQSCLGRQILDSKLSYPSLSFGLEERFDADRRDLRAMITPGPGAYRV